MALATNHALGQPITHDDINAIATEANSLRTAVTALPSTIDARIAAYLSANSYFPIVTYNDGDPIPSGYPNGTLYVKIAAGAGAPTFTQTAGALLTTDGTSFATTAIPAASGGFVFLHVTAAQTAGAGDYPTTVTGGGTTWTSVQSQKSANGNGASRVYRSALSPTGGAVTLGFAASMANVMYRAVAVQNVNTTTPVVQSAASTSGSTAPSVSLSAVNPNNSVLAFYWQNSGSETATVGSGYTQIGTQLATVSPEVPTGMADAMYRNDGVNLANWSTSGTSQKNIIALEIASA